jgi:signal transduction histidine kinase
MGVGEQATSSRRPGVRLAVLVWGLVGSLLFVTFSAVVSTAEVSRAQREVIGLFRDGERTTYLIGRIGDELALGRLTLRVAASRDSPGEARGEVARRDSDIAAFQTELVQLLSPEERQTWNDLEPDIEQLRRSQMQALAELERGDGERAQRLLDDLMSRALGVQRQLDELRKRNRSKIHDLLERAERRLALVQVLELTVGAILLVVVGMAWVIAIRTIRSQRQRIDDYMLQLETAKNDLDAFAGRIAHDLKNVLGPVLLSGEVMRREHGSPDAVERAVQRIERSSTRATELLDALLAFSRAGQPVIEPAASSLIQEVHACVEDLKPLAERVSATVTLELPDDLRSSVAPTLLRSVVSNLLSNALKFIEGRDRREVRISARRADERQCLLLIEDTGPGIPEASLSKIFEPFYRVPGTSAPGTGIGLATVHRIVTAHSGSIRAASVPGEGARFEIRLPLAPDRATDRRARLADAITELP